MKRTFCLILSLLICLALLPAAALAEEEPALDGGPTVFEVRTECYIVGSDGKYTPGGGTITVSETLAEPGSYIGYSVEPADGCRLLSVTVGNGVTIGKEVPASGGFYMENYVMYVAATFEKVPGYDFVVDVDPAGTGMVKLADRQNFYVMTIDLGGVPAGVHTLEAVPLGNHAFDRWTDQYGTYISSDNPYQITTMGDVHLKAVFKEVPDYYSVTDGDDGIWTRGADGDYKMTAVHSFQSSECYLLFMEAEVDGVVPVMGPDYDYGPGEDGTVVTFYKSFLETLAPGYHKVILRFATGEAESGFTVAKAAVKPTLTIGDDGIAVITGDFEGLYARVALVLDNNGVSGLYVTQATINSDGTIVVPVFNVPGLKVKGVNISLVPSIKDIPSATPTVIATASLFYT